MIFGSHELRKAIRRALDSDTWTISGHAKKQMLARGFIDLDVKMALRNGHHVPLLDELKNESWRYRVHGKTVDGKNVGLAVVFDDGMFIVTVIDI